MSKLTINLTKEDLKELLNGYRNGLERISRLKMRNKVYYWEVIHPKTFDIGKIAFCGYSYPIALIKALSYAIRNKCIIRRIKDDKNH